MIRTIQKKWEVLDKKQIKTITDEFSISRATAKKYIHMPEEEIVRLDTPLIKKKRKTVMDDYLNIIYKMLRDKKKPAVIMSYVIKKGYSGNHGTLETYIRLIAKNNFNIRYGINWAYNLEYPDNITVIKRNTVLKYITTKKSNKEEDEVMAQHIEAIGRKYPIVSSVKEMYDAFHEIIMGNDPEKLDGFIEQYKNTAAKIFVDGIAKDIIPIKNAISHDESNGFVEGNNNKFKLIKRILYGRADMAYLFKKSYLAFKIKTPDFSLSQIVKKMSPNEASFLLSGNSQIPNVE